MDSIAGSCMRLLEGEQIARNLAYTCTAKSHPRGGERTKPGRIWFRQRFAHVVSSLSGLPASTFSRASPSLSSQASNSGAGRSPSTRRR